MKTRTGFLFASLAVTIVLFSAAAAHAQTDKTVIITQETATFGRGGDPPGFPIVIGTAGAYKLGSNIVVPDGFNSAIVITASNVTLDLNGFSIIGAGVVTGAPGITGTGQSRVRISNGVISGFVRSIEFLGASEFITLERLHIDTAAGPTGPFGTIKVGRDKAARAIIRDVITNGQIAVTCPSLVLDTLAKNVVEANLPFDGSGVGFPTNCAGENVKADL